MKTSYIDIHPHVISDDDARYPQAPLFGTQSEWSQERPVTMASMIEALEAAGIQKAAIVQSSTCYGFDNSYVADCCAAYPGRFTAVGSIDMLAPDATEVMRKWLMRGVTGLRLFTGGTTKAFDTSLMDDPRSFGTWELCGDLGVTMCIQTGPAGLTQIAGLAKRFPKVNIILDHLSRPVIEDGAPYHKASSLFALVPFENIFLKITPRTTDLVQKGAADAESFFTKLVTSFGSHRLAWGSNFPANEGTVKDNLETAKQMLAFLPAHDQQAIFAGTAQKLYPALAD